jgi:hypothetical protein
LRRVWLQNFTLTDGKIGWRDHDNIPPTGRYIASPYDTDARYATKRQTYWVGYNIHLTETYATISPISSAMSKRPTLLSPMMR